MSIKIGVAIKIYKSLCECLRQRIKAITVVYVGEDIRYLRMTCITNSLLVRYTGILKNTCNLIHVVQITNILTFSVIQSNGNFRAMNFLTFPDNYLTFYRQIFRIKMEKLFS